MAARLLASALAHLGAMLAAQARGWAGASRHAARRAWAGRPSAARGGAILLSACLAVAGLSALSAQARRPSRLPSALDWRAAAALLQRDARAGDAVLVAPAWLERARELATPGVPVLATTRLADERLAGVRRVWLLAAAQVQPARRELGPELARRARAQDAQRLGALEVTRFDLGSPVVPLARLDERPPPGAAVLQRDAAGLARRCLELRPAPGAPATAAFPAMPLGRTLAGHATLLPGAGEATARIAFRVDGQEVGALELAGAGWRSFELDTGRQALGAHLVTVEAGPDRPVCLEALALP